MKASELAAQLRHFVNTQGDFYVTVHDDGVDYHVEGVYTLTLFLTTVLAIDGGRRYDGKS